MNREDACSRRKFIFCGTGILPVADNGARYQIDCQLTFYEQAFRPVKRENLSFVEQASCLLLTMVQDIRAIVN